MASILRLRLQPVVSRHVSRHAQVTLKRWRKEQWSHSHTFRSFCSSVEPQKQQHQPATKIPPVALKPTQDEEDNKAKDATQGLRVEAIIPTSPKPPKAKNKRKPTTLISSVQSSVTSLIAAIPGYLIKFLNGSWSVLKTAVTNPAKLIEWTKLGWEAVKDFVVHTGTGFKLLGLEIRTSASLLRKKLNGHTLTRRERKQLVRTVTDLARMVPFSFFIIIPAMEIFLPFALKLFPNMLPSTFQDSYKQEESMKNQLKLRLELASFLQEMVIEMGQKVVTKGRDESEDERHYSVEELQQFIMRTRIGDPLPPDVIFKVAKLFSDEMTIENMSRSQLSLLCRYMGLTSYGGNEFLRFQLRQSINSLREDDRQIYWEGVDALNLLELKQACQDRGMRATGLTREQLRAQLLQWLELSVNKNVSVSLLILSRAFTLDKPKASTESDAISEAIGQMDAEITRVALAEGVENVAKADLKTLTAMKLEAIQLQNELIKAESKEKQPSKKSKKAREVEAPPEEVVDPVGAADDIAKPFAKEEPMEDIAEELKTETEDELSVSEVSEALESLSVLAAASSVESEKKQLEEIVQKQAQLTSEEDVHADVAKEIDTSEEAEVEEEVDQTSAILQERVAKMLDKLQQEVDSVEVSIGDKLKLLDADGDGVVSCNELRHAIQTGLKENYSDDDVEKLLSKLDLDHDGIVTLEELNEVLTSTLAIKQQQE